MKKRSSGRILKRSTKPRRATRNIALRARETDPLSTKAEHPAAVTPAPQPPSAYVRIFGRFFRSFRIHMFECLGERSRDAIIRAEKKISLLAPEYDREALTDDTAPLLVDVVEEIVRGSSFFRRPKLRRAAILLVADLYNKHYQILEERSAIERIEQVYYRLKS